MRFTHSNRVKVIVTYQLLVKGVSFILGNDSAGGRVFPVSSVFPICVVTLERSCKFDDVVDFAETFMAMCSVKRFPKAVPLCTLQAKTVIKDLITGKLFSTFGLPKF